MGKRKTQKAEFVAAIRKSGLSHTVHNNGLHWIISLPRGRRAEVWPTTGKWKVAGVWGNGLEPLDAMLTAESKNQVEPMHKVTATWLAQYQTPAGGYRKAQIAALGLSWPPPPNWKQWIVGCAITKTEADRFEVESGWVPKAPPLTELSDLMFMPATLDAEDPSYAPPWAV